MKINKILISIFIFSLILITKGYTYENKILFKVNNEIITNVDIELEYKYLTALNNDLNKIPKEEALKISKDSLIREKIKTDEM